MEEVENTGVEQAIVQDIADPSTEATQEQSEAQVVENKNERNWRELRRSKEELAQTVKLQNEMLQRLMNQSTQAPPPPEEEDILAEIEREEFVPGAKVAKGFKKLEEKFKKDLDAVRAHYEQTNQNTLLSELKREFADFEDVVNPDTLATLDETNPRLAKSIASSKDMYSIAIQSYEYIKAKGLHKRDGQTRRTQETEKAIEQNKKVVQSPQVFDKRPLAQAFHLNEQTKKDLLAEMTHYARMAGSGY